MHKNESARALSPIPCKNNLYELGVQLPHDFEARNFEIHKPWKDIPLVIEEEQKPNSFACYEKFFVYPNRSTEISPEELRGFRWFVKKGELSAPVVKEYSHLLNNIFESGARLYPGFIAKNLVSEPEVKYPTKLNEATASRLQVRVSKIFENGVEVASTEELLAEKYKRGGIKLGTNDLNEGNKENVDMELTVIGKRHHLIPTSSSTPVARKPLQTLKQLENANVVSAPVAKKSIGTLVQAQLLDDLEKANFKIPQIPAAPHKQKDALFTIYEDEAAPSNEIGVDNDKSKSIHYESFEQEVAAALKVEWEDEKMCSFIASSENRYEHTIIKSEAEQYEQKVRDAIEMSHGNPFCPNLRTVILEQVNFEEYLENYVPGCVLLKNIPKLKEEIKLQIEEDEFIVKKLVTEGRFGTIHVVENSEGLFAAKQVKPTNLWEYFIYEELLDRLKSNHLNHMLPAFMSVTKSIIANNSSILISKFSKYGSLTDVCKKFHKVTSRNLDEYIVMVLTCQLLSIIDFLHGCHIIHANVKPENFLLISP